MDAGYKISYQSKTPQKSVKNRNFPPIISVYTINQNRQDVKLFLYRIILLYKSSYGSIVMVDAVFAKPETGHRTGKDLQV